MRRNSTLGLERIRTTTGLAQDFPASLVELDNAVLWLDAANGAKRLAIAAAPGNPLLEQFDGKATAGPD